MDREDNYLILLRRELVRAQARLKRAERERDDLRAENQALRKLLAEHGVTVPGPAS
jgi:Ser/Thr protein kinase RdoA (MazF antagonist)